MCRDSIPSDIDRTERSASMTDAESSTAAPWIWWADDEASPSALVRGQSRAEMRFGWVFRLYAESKPPGLGHLFIG